MDILDVKIVRIKDHDTETDLTLDTYFPVDAESYPPVPKKMSWRSMVSYIISLFFSTKIYVAKGQVLRADMKTAITFPVAFETDYIIVPTFVHASEQTGLLIEDETSTGFSVTALGGETTIDFVVLPITPLP